MKLIYRIATRLSLAMTLLLVVWAGLFYFAVIEEVNDETDDMLEEYSEELIMRYLGNKPMPQDRDRSNNEYEFRPLSQSEVIGRPQLIFADTTVYLRSKHEGEAARMLRTIFYDREGNAIELTVLTPTIEKVDFKFTILMWSVALWGVLLITIIGLNMLIYRNTMRPLYRILHWLRIYKLGQKNTPLKETGTIVEFRELKEAIVRYTERAEEAYDTQKLFIANLSHELQTPMAIARHQLEYLMEQEHISEQDLEALASAYGSIEHITRLSKSLMMLFRIDNHQYKADKHIDLAEMVRMVLPNYQEIYQSMHVRVELRVSSPWIIHINEMLANVLINNLIKNAFVHNHVDGEVYIDITPTSIVIANTGQSTPLDPKKLYTRFYQTRSTEETTGLGLALIEAICRASSLCINYEFVDNRHSFEISKLIQNHVRTL